MNEILFFAHILVVVGFAAFALRRAALVPFVVLQALLANLFVTKQMVLFGLTVTCSDVYSIGCLLSLNLLQEFFGKEEAKKAIEVSFLSMVFFALMSQVHLLYVPSPSDTAHSACLQLFSSTPRIIFASIAVFYFVQKIDMKLFGYLQKRFCGRQLSLRLVISLVASQFVDTVLFSFLGLYGIVSPLFDIIVVSLMAKGLAIAASAPFTALIRRARVV